MALTISIPKSRDDLPVDPLLTLTRTALGLGVHIRRQRALPHDIDVVLEMGRIDRPDDARVKARVGEGEAQDELHRRHATQQIVKPHLLPPCPLHAVVLALQGRTLGGAASNDDAGPSLRGFSVPRTAYRYRGRYRAAPA